MIRQLVGSKATAADYAQVVRGCCEREHPVHLENPTMPNFAKQRDGLQPPETFFDPFPLGKQDTSPWVSRRGRQSNDPASGMVVASTTADDVGAQLPDPYSCHQGDTLVNERLESALPGLGSQGQLAMAREGDEYST